MGDFIVTLPTLKALRDRFSKAHIELMGYPRFGELGLNRFYLNGFRSIDYGPLSGFFIPNGVLDPGLMDYFDSFDLVLSYFFDPDLIFEQNLKRCTSAKLIAWAPQVAASPAAAHFAAPLREIGIEISDLQSRVFLSPEDLERGRLFLKEAKPLKVAVHIGSGSETKNWPINNWSSLLQQIQERFDVTLVLVVGEADQERFEKFVNLSHPKNSLTARSLPLPELAGILANCNLFIGHDSGVTHLAAAVNTPSIALFGPTDPKIWAPPGPLVTVLQAGSDVSKLSVDVVAAEAFKILKPGS